MEAIDGDVHLLSLSQRSESVQAALLIDILEILEEGHVDVEQHVLVPEVCVGGAIGPDQQDSAHHARDEVMSSPPTFDTGPIHNQNRFPDNIIYVLFLLFNDLPLPDGESAVIPNNQKHDN